MTELSSALFARHLTALLPKVTTQYTLYVAYSGGVDSSVLLHLAVQFAAEKQLNIGNQLNIKALHVNHGVSEQALDWQHFCQQQCAKLQVDCLVEQLDLSAVTTNFEQIAREQRYSFFAQHVKPDDVLMTAHHQDDQIETVLMRLLRGTGVRGLSGIAAVKTLNGMQVVRPLLDCDKQSLIAFAKHNCITSVEDDSNTALQFDRNALRHTVLPVLNAEFVTGEQGIVGAAKKAAIATVLLDELGEMDSLQCQVSARVSWFDLATPLLWSKLSQFSDERIFNAVDVWAQPHFHYPLPRARLGELIEQIKIADNTSCPMLAHEGKSLRYFEGGLHLLSVLPNTAPDSIVWVISRPLTLSTLGLELLVEPEVAAHKGVKIISLSDNKVEVAWRQGGERICQKGRDHSQSYKKCLQENKVPHWNRQYLPMIKVGDTLVWTGVLGHTSYQVVDSAGKSVNFIIRKLNTEFV